MAYKIIQAGTGNVGLASIRAALARPQFQLVGAYVYSDAKNGMDLGEIAHLGAIGVRATSNFDDILAMEADCVVYNALGDTRDKESSTTEICRILESGKNVVSTALSRYIHPDSMPAEARERISAACAKGGVSFHASGINPGFTFDALPIFLSSVTDTVERVDCAELVDMSTDISFHIAHEHIGLGQDPDWIGPMDRKRPFGENPFNSSLKLVEEAFRVRFDETRINIDKAIAAESFEVDWGTVGKGKVAARKQRMEALIDGVTRFTWTLVWRARMDIAPDWPSGEAGWQIDFKGEPDMKVRVDVEAHKGRSISVVTAMSAFNAVERVIQAPPGIVTRLGLPLFAGHLA